MATVTRVLLLALLAAGIAHEASAWSWPVKSSKGEVAVEKPAEPVPTTTEAAVEEAAAVADVDEDDEGGVTLTPEVHTPDHYYYNEITKETQWHQPVYEFFAEEDGRPYYLDPTTGETSWDKPDSLAWEVRNDQSGLSYYNTITGETTSEKPFVLAWHRADTIRDEL